MALARLVVLISGGGSNLQALIDASERGELGAAIVGVVSNRADAYGLERARQHGIPTQVMPKLKDRGEYDRKLAEVVAGFAPDYVVLAGWLRLLSMQFLKHYPQRVINLHPALPGTFAGLHAVERALEAYQRGELSHTGVMVHLVPDEGVDDGPVLASEPLEIRPDDTLETLSERIHTLEHGLLVRTVRAYVAGELEPVRH